MLNFFKLKEGANSFFLIVVLVVGFLWTLSQTAVLMAELGYKEYAKETKVIEYVIKKDGKVFRNTYDVTAYVDEEGVFYNTTMTEHEGEK